MSQEQIATVALVPTPRLACDYCAIRHRGVCGALSAEEIADVNAIAVRKRFEAGQVVQWQHDHAKSVGNILDGVLKVMLTLEDGRVQIVGLLFPGDFVGRTYAEEATATIEAATECEICTFPRVRFETLMQRYHNLESRLFHRTLNKLDSAHNWMLLLGRKTATERVATFLLTIARRFSHVGCHRQGEARTEVFDMPLTRADTADYLGLTIETVSRQITRLRKSGIISVVNNRTIEVLDMERLVEAAGEDERSGGALAEDSLP